MEKVGFDNKVLSLKLRFKLRRRLNLLLLSIIQMVFVALTVKFFLLPQGNSITLKIITVKSKKIRGINKEDRLINYFDLSNSNLLSSYKLVNGG